MMLGQCMLLIIASDMVNRMPIPALMECKASDYAESQQYKSRDMQTDINFVEALSFTTEPLSFSQDTTLSAI